MKALRRYWGYIALVALVLAWASLEIGLGVIMLLPATPPADTVPAELLWSFRLYSVAATGILWLGLGAGFGLAGWRAARPVARARTTTMTAS